MILRNSGDAWPILTAPKEQNGQPIVYEERV